MTAKRKNSKNKKRSSATYQMGKIYVDGMEEEEPQSSFSDYEEVDDDDSKAGKARKLISSKNAGSEPDARASSDADDPFLKNFDYDPDENWPE